MENHQTTSPVLLTSHLVASSIVEDDDAHVGHTSDNNPCPTFDSNLQPYTSNSLRHTSHRKITGRFRFGLVHSPVVDVHPTNPHFAQVSFIVVSLRMSLIQPTHPAPVYFRHDHIDMFSRPIARFGCICPIVIDDGFHQC